MDTRRCALLLATLSKLLPKSSKVSKFWVTRDTNCSNLGSDLGHVLQMRRTNVRYIELIHGENKQCKQCKHDDTYLRYSNNSGNSREPAGSSGPSLVRIPSQSKSRNHGCLTTCLKPFSSPEAELPELLPIRDSGPANKQDKKSIHSGLSVDLVSAGISRH